ncbi:MAG: hypothetical protein ABI746_02460 [Dermatophilaceae bacterium]
MPVPAQKPSTSPISLRHRPTPRTAQLLVGLVLFGVGEGLIMAAGLGVLPWDVLSQGLVKHFGLTVGAWSVIIGVSVLLLWIPLRERPGVGTILNALIIGPVLDATLHVVSPPGAAEVQVAMLVVGVLINGVASAIYIGARLGPGPRDGVMTALVRITGRSVRLVRTSIEVTVVIVGFALGGNLGVGTLLYALAIGPIIHATLPYVLARDDRPPELT